MTEIQQQAQSLIEQTLKLAHSTLSKNPSISSQSRDLSAVQHLIIQGLNKNNFLYHTLVTALAIDSYAFQITKQGSLLEQVSALLTIVFQKMNKLDILIQDIDNNKQINRVYEQTYEAIKKIVNIYQDICPKSAYISQQNDLINKKGNKINQSLKKAQDSLQTKLRNQNQQLKKQLKINDQKIVQMELKLTEIIKQSRHNSNSLKDSNPDLQNRHNMMNYLQIKQQLAYKQAEIQRMNEQFSYQIQKYNTVYDAMKRQLQELKAYQNIDLIEQIQLLQTQIVRLREQRQRDQIIIKQLRSDSMMNSNSSHLSPRSNGRFHNLRYNY